MNATKAMKLIEDERNGGSTQAGDYNDAELEQDLADIIDAGSDADSDGAAMPASPGTGYESPLIPVLEDTSNDDLENEAAASGGNKKIQAEHPEARLRQRNPTMVPSTTSTHWSLMPSSVRRHLMGSQTAKSSFDS